MPRYFVEISRTVDGGYDGLVHDGDPRAGSRREQLALGPLDEVEIKGKRYSLSTLSHALIQYDKGDLKVGFDEQGQLAIGYHLYDQLFARASMVPNPQNDDIDLRIVSTDEHILQLPWVLLAHGKVFLAVTGWCVSLSLGRSLTGVSLPLAPRLLIVRPNPSSRPETDSEGHIDQLLNQLKAVDPGMVMGENVRVVCRWSEVQEQLGAFQPDLLYYYGHGVGNNGSSRLVLEAESGTGKGEDLRPVADLGMLLDNLRDVGRTVPQVVYLNCCHGDAGGMLGAGAQLADRVPVVVTNRTIAEIAAAQHQALTFWTRVLIDGEAPHVAMTRVWGDRRQSNLTFADPRWLTPVLYCGYGEWRSGSTRRQDPRAIDPHWTLKLDRKNQFGRVMTGATSMLRDRRPRSWAFVTYGLEEQGVEELQRRVDLELSRLVADDGFVSVRPDWQTLLESPPRAFQSQLRQAFRVGDLRELGELFRRWCPRAADRCALLHVWHEPVDSRHKLNPSMLKQYLQWWDAEFVPLLPAWVHAVLSIGFIVRQPEAFREAVRSEGIRRLALRRVSQDVLDELGNVTADELEEFMIAEGIVMADAARAQVVDGILATTNGAYRPTIGLLDKWMDLEFSVMTRPPIIEAPPEYIY